MADTTISSLPLGTPSGSALLPYSTGFNTLGVPISGIFQNTNSVGIGSIPGQALDVVGNIRLGQPSISNYDNKLQFWNSNYANEVASIQANGNYNLLFNTRDASGVLAERMRINNVGNVGIGTTTPAAKLDVNGDVKSTTTSKAWVSFNGQGAAGANQSIYSQYNVSSVVKRSPLASGWDGMYTINFTNALASDNYCIIGTAGGTGGSWGAYVCNTWGDSEGGLQTTTSCRIGVMSYGGWRGVTIVNVMIFGN